MLPATDATAAIYALDGALRVPYAEVRAATDLIKDPWGQFIEHLAKASVQKLKASAATTVGRLSTPEAASAVADDLPLAGMNPWLVDTMSIIDTGRKNLAKGQLDGISGSRLDSAEMLASFITEIGPRRRPQLNIEPSGRPTFATATDNFYIHLTVDTPNRLTWYAVVGGTEYFDDGVVFDGRKLPPALAQLFSL